MFSIKSLQEKKDNDKKEEKEVSLKDLSALQSVACSVVKSSIADSNQVGAQG